MYVTNDISYMDYRDLNDLAILRKIGEFIKHHRINQRRSQDQLAKDAGISRSTLSLLERGEKVNLITLIQVLRVLDQLQVLEVLEVKQEISPLEYIKLQKNQPKRIRNIDMAAEEPPTTW